MSGYEPIIDEELTEEDRAAMAANVDASFKRDPERFIDSYINHSTEAVRRRVVAHLSTGNGHSNRMTILDD